jgi:hypothetical protein
MNLIKRKLKQRQNIERVEHSNNENRMTNKYATKFEEYDDFIDEKLNEDYSQVYAEAFYEAEERTEMQANNQHDSQPQSCVINFENCFIFIMISLLDIYKYLKRNFQFV